MIQEKVLLKLLKPWKIYKIGDVVSVPAGILPERMIRNNTAERYLPQKKTKVKEDGNDSQNSTTRRADKLRRSKKSLTD